MNSTTVIGSEIKFALSLELPGGLTMDDVEFEVLFYTSSSQAVAISKSRMARQDNGSYSLILDTSLLGRGRLIKCQVKVDLPDSDADNGTRTEILFLDTNEMVRNGLR